MRLFIGGLATETNTFSPLPTGLEAFAEYGIGPAAGNTPISGPVHVWRERARRDGHSVSETICCFAQPGGVTVADAHHRLRDQILADLEAAGPVDLILLMLHGAMVAQGCDDCEGDLLQRVRERAPEAVIGVELDLHCQLSAAMVDAADLIVVCKEYPHIDFEACAERLYDLAVTTARGELSPVAAMVDTRMVGFYPTFDPPMSGIVSALRDLESSPAILSASLAHGFPWADIADVGTRVLVYADGDASAAESGARAIAKRLYEARHALLPRYPSIEESLEKARGLRGSVVIGDFADNPGCGAAGDSTFFLRRILELGVKDVAIGVFWDPQLARICASAGVGAEIPVRLGGKTGPRSGAPLDLVARVRAVVEAHSQGAFGNRQPMGLSVWIESGGVDIAIGSVRTQVFERDAFTGLGIDLSEKRLIVVKSSNHYVAGFREHADHLWHAASPGTTQLDFGALPYTKRDLAYFPREDDPWASRGAPPVTLHSRRRAS